MNYSLLKLWSQTMAEYRPQIEAVTRHKQTVGLCFKDGRVLSFVLRPNDSFPVLLPSGESSGEPLWNQLRHAQVQRIWLDPSDRILYLEIRQTDIYQEVRDWQLIAELCPPRPNIILCEIQNGKPVVMDALHKYSLADNPARQILPRLEYQAPQTSWSPSQTDLRPPFTLKVPESADELRFDDVNSYFLAYYTHVIVAGEERERVRRQTAFWKKAIDKLEKKLAKQRLELLSAEAMETWKLYAEVIKYNLGQINKGQTSLESVNYYDPNMASVLVPLREDLSPAQNMDLYLKRYKKARTGLEVITRHIADGETELRHLQGVLARVEAGEELDFIVDGPKSSKSGHEKLSILDKLLRIRISEEFEIVIGRKASENDFISTQLGRPHDWWFHTRIYRGAHVLLRCLKKTDPPPELKSLCCRLAAWYSKARSSSNVPVDFTQVRYLRKPRRSAPGFITYTDHQTAFVEPLETRKAREELGL